MKHIRLFVLVGLLVVLIAVSPGCASTAKPMETEADFLGLYLLNIPGQPRFLGISNVSLMANK